MNELIWQIVAWVLPLGVVVLLAPEFVEAFGALATELLSALAALVLIGVPLVLLGVTFAICFVGSAWRRISKTRPTETGLSGA